MDWVYRATAKAEGIVINTTEGDDIATFPVELARIRSVGYFIIAGVCATIIFGWAIQKELHISCMLVMTAICGVTFTAVFNVSPPAPKLCDRSCALGLVSLNAYRHASH